MSKFIPVAVPHLSGNEKKYVNDCIDSTWISSNGKYIKEFEKAFADYMGVRNAISCCNGSVALHVPLLARGLRPGDEVLVPSFTYVATANVVKYCGATPVFVDCLEDTWNINMKDAERKITSRTRGIIPVHLYGNPCDMDEVMNLARRKDLFVLEDAAECHGAIYKGKKAGTIGDAGTYSFFGNKIITTGEGGMIVTNNDELAAKIDQLKGQGQDPNRRYWFTEIGYNYRMTNIEAALGLAQLENIEQHIAERRKVANWYMEELIGMEKYLTPQKVTAGAESVWWMFSIKLTNNSKINRDELIVRLAEDHIETRPLFYPMHIMPIYKDRNANCPVSELISSKGLNLPTHAQLAREDVNYICSRIKKYLTE